MERGAGGRPTLNWYIFHDPAGRAREGRQLRLWFDPARLHLFNPGNGAHLTL